MGDTPFRPPMRKIQKIKRKVAVSIYDSIIVKACRLRRIVVVAVVVFLFNFESIHEFKANARYYMFISMHFVTNEDLCAVDVLEFPCPPLPFSGPDQNSSDFWGGGNHRC